MTPRKIVTEHQHIFAMPSPLWVAVDVTDAKKPRYGYGATEQQAIADLDATWPEDET